MNGLSNEVIADSVSAQRKRAPARRVANVNTTQIDYEDRRSELQRYLVQQRKRQELQGGRPMTSSSGSSGRGGGATSVNEPPPFCETPNGQLQARRRYIPKNTLGIPGGTSMAPHSSVFGGARRKPGLFAKAWALFICYASLVPSKYLWIIFGLMLLNARRLIAMFVSSETQVEGFGQPNEHKSEITPN
ncbi:transmembrane protein, putative [Bodo saltans]|uniref:Transmembrane protein, putative n=1 Tax=Bodo saltans TaxID=75058 RepID=A0A0S4JFK5_BODSA|nr:transmembrane protein, putative [Bodo saltans]|eukprot:CUG90378.1 transmembrane protein, putative [Bodo saltans]